MGALIAGPVADRVGRKWSISAWCVMLHIGLIVQMTAAQGKWYQSESVSQVNIYMLALNVPSCRREMDRRSWCWFPIFAGANVPK